MAGWVDDQNDWDSWDAFAPEPRSWRRDASRYRYLLVALASELVSWVLVFSVIWENSNFGIYVMGLVIALVLAGVGWFLPRTVLVIVGLWAAYSLVLQVLPPYPAIWFIKLPLDLITLAAVAAAAPWRSRVDAY